MPRTPNAAGIALAAVLGLIAAPGARADALFQVTDLGPANQSTPETANLFGVGFLRIDPAGNVTTAPGGPWPSSVPVPSGMRPRDADGPPGASPDGRYLVGTAFASQEPSAPWAGFVVHDGQATPIGLLDGHGGPSAFSAAFAVNNQGEVVGTAGTSSPFATEAILTNQPGQLVGLGTLGGSQGEAFGLNNAGLIVGSSTLADGSTHAFLDDGQTMADLNKLISPTAGWLLTSATGINDSGQIAAYGRDATGAAHIIRLTPIAAIPPLAGLGDDGSPTDPPTDPIPQPVPEPGVPALLGLGALAEFVRRSRRRRS